MMGNLEHTCLRTKNFWNISKRVSLILKITLKCAIQLYNYRQRELKQNGWNFVWITDGNGWKAGQNQMAKAFEEIDFVLNVNFVKKGFLKYIIEKIK